MATTQGTGEFAAYCVELLGALGAACARRMFGGHGLYIGDRFVAIVAGQRLYLKTDAATRAAFEAARCEPFAFDAAGGRRQVLGYWSVPEDAMESAAAMRPWAMRALDAALRAAARPKPTARKRPAAATRKP